MSTMQAGPPAARMGTLSDVILTAAQTGKGEAKATFVWENWSLYQPTSSVLKIEL